MKPTQIAVLAIALAGFAGLLVFSPKLRIRPWVLLLAGLAGTALALLAALLVSRITSLGQMAGGVSLVCAAGALGSVAVNLAAQRAKRRVPRELLPARPSHTPRQAGVVSGMSDALASAQGRESAMLNTPSAPQAALAAPPVREAPADDGAMTPSVEPAAVDAAPSAPEQGLDDEPQAEPGGQTAGEILDVGDAPEETAPPPDAGAETAAQAEETAETTVPGEADVAAGADAPAEGVPAQPEAPAEEANEIDRLARGFRREQERLARVEERRRLKQARLHQEEEERLAEQRRRASEAEEQRLAAERLAREEEDKRRERERLALEEELRLKEQERATRDDKRRRDRERRIRRGEERRLKDTRLGAAEADEAQRIRERIKAERQKVAMEEQMKLDAEVAAASAAELAAAEKRRLEEDATAAASWEMEQQRLARELDERKREQEKAAEEEKRWLMEQERLAREQEERRLEQERLAREAEGKRLESERLSREQEERRLEQERLAREQEERRLEAERLAREAEETSLEAERLAREQEERRLEQERAVEEQRRWQEEQQRLEREQEERRREQKRLEREERERRERAEREKAEQDARLFAEATGYLDTGRELAEAGRYIEALPWLEKAARVDTANELKIAAGIASLETLIALGWKGEALKKMQAMKAGLAIDAESRRRLGELAMKLVG